MRLLVDDEWADGCLDHWRAPSELRIEVQLWIVVLELDDIHFEREASVRTLLDYGRDVGPVEVARKVWSRWSERSRNDEVAAVGRGVVVEADDDHRIGETVTFFAPCAPRCPERVVLPGELVWESAPGECKPGKAISVGTRIDQRYSDAAGWRRESGVAPDDLGELRSRVDQTLRECDDLPMKRFTFDRPTAVFERRRGPHAPIFEDRRSRSESSEWRTALFGYGHYARTVIVPNLPAELRPIAVHELDPRLIPDDASLVDTAPHLRDEEEYDLVVIAGYHASHAPLAAQALRRGAAVLCEKPLATTKEQLDDLLDAWTDSTRYFAGFQRRYSPVNDWVAEDLAPDKTNPLSYHAIVHEVKLPARHWYRWPASGSRLLSNGCHWIDHFLYLNDFAEVVDAEARRGPTGEISVSMALANDAYFTLTLTDRGSDRLGVREHTELRVRDRTAIVTDSKEYVSEGPSGLIRRQKFNKLAAHRAMYARIAKNLVVGEPGDERADTRTSVVRSARVVLELEDQLNQAD